MFKLKKPRWVGDNVTVVEIFVPHDDNDDIYFHGQRNRQGQSKTRKMHAYFCTVHKYITQMFFAGMQKKEVMDRQTDADVSDALHFSLNGIGSDWEFFWEQLTFG